MQTEMQVRAAKALGELGQAEEAAELLSTLTWNDKADAFMRVRAAEALGELERAEEAAEFLLALARGRGVEKEVLAGLWTLAEEPETPESVRRAAWEALERLEE